jgi:hypothetical protein
MTLKHSDFDTENRMGFFVGPTVKLALPVVGLGLDLSALYNYRESELEGETVKQHSLDIPLNVRYSLGMGGVANVFVAAGPQVAFNLGDREVDLDMVNDWRFRDSFFSFNVGGGLTLINTLELSARYNIPIGNTNDVTWSKKRLPADDYEANLLKIINAFHSANVKTIIVTIPPCIEEYVAEREKYTPEQRDALNDEINELNAKAEADAVENTPSPFGTGSSPQTEMTEKETVPAD